MPAQGSALLHEFTLFFLPAIIMPEEQMKGQGIRRLDQPSQITRGCPAERQAIRRWSRCRSRQNVPTLVPDQN